MQGGMLKHLVPDRRGHLFVFPETPIERLAKCDVMVFTEMSLCVVVPPLISSRNTRRFGLTLFRW